MDQAHRGYSASDDESGFRSINPLFMKYTPSEGDFSGQMGYGYRSLEVFVDSAGMVRRRERAFDSFDRSLATAASTLRTTAILEAGRRSLDAAAPICILYVDPTQPCSPSGFEIATSNKKTEVSK